MEAGIHEVLGRKLWREPQLANQQYRQTTMKESQYVHLLKTMLNSRKAKVMK